MKSILFTAVCFIALLSCKAQTYPMESNKVIFPESGVSFKDTNNNLDKYEGTWEYTDSSIRFKIVLQKIEDYDIGGFLSDVIVGNILYEVNGVEIINTLTNPAASQGSIDIYHIEMSAIRNAAVIIGIFEDPIRSKWTMYSLGLTYSRELSLNGTSPPVEQLKWGVVIDSFYNPDYDPDAEQALRVPKVLILTKV